MELLNFGLKSLISSISGKMFNNLKDVFFFVSSDLGFDLVEVSEFSIHL